MQHSLREFLRHGGSGQYVFARQNGAVYGYQAGISIKSLFPGYADLRADFTKQLDRVIAENTRMLLNAPTPADTVPWVAEAEAVDLKEDLKRLKKGKAAGEVIGGLNIKIAEAESPTAILRRKPQTSTLPCSI